MSGPSIGNLSSAVFDNGRRGEPKMGCDCMRCFGYCLYDGDKASRDAADRSLAAGDLDEPILGAE